MNHRQLLVFHLVLALSATTAAASSPLHVDVFKARETVLSSHAKLAARCPECRINIHVIDGIKETTAGLSRDLPTDAKLAKREVLQRMKRFDKDQQDRLRQSAEALLLAARLRVARVPAVVFERQWVIYGVNDLLHAHNVFAAHRNGERQ